MLFEFSDNGIELDQFSRWDRIIVEADSEMDAISIFNGVFTYTPDNNTICDCCNFFFHVYEVKADEVIKNKCKTLFISEIGRD